MSGELLNIKLGKQSCTEMGKSKKVAGDFFLF